MPQSPWYAQSRTGLQGPRYSDYPTMEPTEYGSGGLGGAWMPPHARTSWAPPWPEWPRPDDGSDQYVYQAPMERGESGASWFGNRPTSWVAPTPPPRIDRPGLPDYNPYLDAEPTPAYGRGMYRRGGWAPPMSLPDEGYSYNNWPSTDPAVALRIAQKLLSLKNRR
jgi:hypothetical protein